MKVKDIVAAYNGFKEMGELILTSQEGFDIGMIMRELNPIVENFEVQRNKKIIELGTADESGSYTVANENKQKFFDEISALENKEIDFKLQYPKFKLRKNNSLQPRIVWAIMDFIELVEQGGD